MQDFRMETKICFKCGIEKSLEDFYVHSRMHDGHLNKCKECTKKDSEQQYNLRIQSVDFVLSERERTRERYHRLNYRDKYKPDTERKKQTMQRYYENYPTKREARGVTRRAVLSGKIEKLPCKVCGTMESLEAHHEDYSKPLEVTWYCIKHHNERHNEIRKEELLKRSQIKQVA